MSPTKKGVLIGLGIWAVWLALIAYILFVSLGGWWK